MIAAADRMPLAETAYHKFFHEMCHQMFYHDRTSRIRPEGPSRRRHLPPQHLRAGGGDAPAKPMGDGGYFLIRPPSRAEKPKFVRPATERTMMIRPGRKLA